MCRWRRGFVCMRHCANAAGDPHADPLPQAGEGVIVELRRRVLTLRSICVLTGAGMSAESGIPTFRDALTGLWSRFDQAQLASEDGFRADAATVWAWYAERRCWVRAARPNAGHHAL